ncbi:hypothetical protein TWF481_009142 [Arthrobotrys musiformis]|uniref:C3H1-type domain-containing protein n=1 Tax=Arthrobotrys musiformis TaxID=47236 RepID=A0AAV9W8L7_9PEZI
MKEHRGKQQVPHTIARPKCQKTQQNNKHSPQKNKRDNSKPQAKKEIGREVSSSIIIDGSQYEGTPISINRSTKTPQGPFHLPGFVNGGLGGPLEPLTSGIWRNYRCDQGGLCRKSHAVAHEGHNAEKAGRGSSDRTPPDWNIQSEVTPRGTRKRVSLSKRSCAACSRRNCRGDISNPQVVDVPPTPLANGPLRCPSHQPK